MPTLLENDRALFPPVGSSDQSGNRTSHKQIFPYDYRPNPADEFGLGVNSIVYIKKAILGTAVVSPGDGLIIRTLPWKNPYDALQYAVKVDFKGLAYRTREDSTVPEVPMATAMKTQYWDCLVHYDNLPYPVGDLDPAQDLENNPDIIYGLTPDPEAEGETVRYCTKEPRVGKEFVTPQTGQCFYDSGGGVPVAVPFAIPQVLPFAEIDVTLWNWPIAAYPKTAVENCIGKCNATDITLPALPDGVSEYKSDSILFLGVRCEPMRFPDSSRGLNITYAFKHRGGKSGSTFINWNTYPFADGSFVRCYRGANLANPIFPSAELNDLFAPEPIP